MKDDRLSSTDELAEILNLYRADKSKKQSDAAEPIPELAATRVSDGPKDAFSEETLPDEETLEPLSAEAASHFSEMEELPTQETGASSHFTDASDEKSAMTEEPEDEEPSEEEQPKRSMPRRIFGGIFRFFAHSTFLVKALIYSLVVLIISAYLSYYIITIGNDVFALVTGNAEVRVTIPDGADEDTVAEILSDQGLIDYKWVFKLYMNHYSDDEIQFIPGTHTLNTNMNYSQLLGALTVQHKARDIVTLTIPEGYTVDQIIDLFVRSGVGTREGFVDAINNYPYKHEFVRLLDENGYPETRAYRLEGYLYPDTYDFYTDTEEYLAINKLLNNFNDKVWIDWKESYAEEAAKRGFSLDDVIVLSSLVQAEGKTAEDFECISYVFHNRLKNKSNFPKLESDATIQYAFALAGLDREQDSSQINVSFESPYNTYLYDGLPPGAICNAGLDAILAAIYPSAPLNDKGNEINAFYFVSNNAGKTYYSATLSGHERNKETVRKENEAMKQNGDQE